MDKPAGFGGACFGLCIEAQKKSGYAGSRCGEHEPAARGKIENFGRPGDFENDCTQRRAGKRIEAGAQKRNRIRRMQEKIPVRIEPQLEKSQRRNLPMFECGEVGPEPQHSPRRRDPRRQRRRKPTGRRFVPRLSRENLMQCAFEDSAFETGIGLPTTERRPRPCVRLAQGGPQNRNFFRCHGHDRPN